jgi:class 3 adenylate cyclase
MFEGLKDRARAVLKGVSPLKTLGLGLGTFLFFVILYFAGAFWGLEEYCQALVVQIGAGKRAEHSAIYVVKKDQTTSALLDKNPDRMEFASVFKYLGQGQKIEKTTKNPPRKFKLLQLDVGYFQGMKGLAFATSYDNWRGVKLPAAPADAKNQNRWHSLERVVRDYYKANPEQEGHGSLVRFKDYIWNPVGLNLFKALSGRSDYMVLPTLAEDWQDEGLRGAVHGLAKVVAGMGFNSFLSDFGLIKGQLEDGGQLRAANLLLLWCYALVNLTDLELACDFYFYREPGAVISFDLNLVIDSTPNEYFVKPTAVVGFDFVLQGQKPGVDEALVEALEQVKSKVVLAGLIVEEERVAQAHEGRATGIEESEETESFTKVYRHDLEQLKATTKETRVILPHASFMQGENIEIGLINVGKSNKSFISEVPMFLLDEKNKRLMPTFSLLVAMHALDARVTGVEPNPEKSYVAAMQRALAESYEAVANKTFKGPLIIADRSIPVDRNGYMLVDFVGSVQKPRTGGEAAIKSLSLYECLDNEYLGEAAALHPNRPELTPHYAHANTENYSYNKGDQIFLVGPFEITDFDYYTTPLTVKTPYQPIKEDLMGIEIHANAVINILDELYIKKPEGVGKAVVMLLASCLILAFALALGGPLWGGALVLIFMALTFKYAHYSYHIDREQLRIAHLLVASPVQWILVTLMNYLRQRARAKNTREMFSRFVSADVVKYMLENPELVKPGGERAELSILFSDVAGFTTMSEALSPEELVVLLNEYLGAMTELLFEYGGTLDKFIGDAVMAFWNYPKKQEDHAEKACLCALDMQKKIAELQEDWKKRDLPEVAVRIGLNTAQVVVGYMGSIQAQMNFTCMGDGVNLAARLEGANKQYGTNLMISEETYMQAQNAVTARFLDFLTVKGKNKPVKVYELVCKKGEEPEGWDKHFEMYNKAIDLHLEREWDQAIAMLGDILQSWPQDGLSLTYLKRCKEYKNNPPPENWNGSYTLTSK